MCTENDGYYAYKSYEHGFNDDTFDKWWEREGVKQLPPKTPLSVMEKFKRIAEASWYRSAVVQDECTTAELGHNYWCRG